MPSKKPVTYQKTLIIIKPDTIGKGLVGRIIQRIEDKGLDIIGIKMIKPTESLAKKHYRGTKQWKISVGAKTIKDINKVVDVEKALGTTDALEVGERVFKRSIESLTQAPIIVMAIGGENAIEEVRKITGSATPIDSSVGTIRGDFSSDSYLAADGEDRTILNVVHRSKDAEEAEHEIPLWFSKDELYPQHR